MRVKIMSTPKNDFLQVRQDKQMVGAVEWATSQDSDPFALARAKAHVRQGLCGPKPNGEDGGYAHNARV